MVDELYAKQFQFVLALDGKHLIRVLDSFLFSRPADWRLVGKRVIFYLPWYFTCLPTYLSGQVWGPKRAHMLNWEGVMKRTSCLKDQTDGSCIPDP